MTSTFDFQIWDRDEPAQKAQWLEAWNAWPEREVFAHPDYSALFRRDGDRVLCAAAGAPSGGILYPFLLRPLAREAWAEPGEKMWDLVGPYGYGGAFAWGMGAELNAGFWTQLESWLENHDVVSSFVRLSLFPEQMQPFRGCVEVNAPNIVRTLDLEPEVMWYDYEHKVRKNVKRAKLSNLSVEVDPAGTRLDEFLAVYYDTLSRREAADSYYYPREFFENLCANLAGQFLFFHVLHEARVVSTELVLMSSRHLYSFLGGTLPEAFAMCPNDLLKHEVNLWGRAAGKRSFVLGGGYGGEDGIYRYKKSFAPNGRTDFWVGKQIHDADAYERLVSRRRGWMENQGMQWLLKSEFFPLYRA